MYARKPVIPRRETVLAAKLSVLFNPRQPFTVHCHDRHISKIALKTYEPKGGKSRTSAPRVAPAPACKFRATDSQKLPCARVAFTHLHPLQKQPSPPARTVPPPP